MRSSQVRGDDLVGEPSDRELLARLRKGDDEAYALLWQRHHAAALRAARQFDHSTEAEDIAAEAFARVLSAVRQGNGPTEAFRAYLLRSVANVAQNTARSRRRAVVSDDETVFDSPVAVDDPAVAAVDRAFVAQAYDKLTPPQKEILWYVEVERTPTKDAAALMGLSSNAAAAVALRAREALRREFLQIHIEQATDKPECQATLDRLARYVRGTLTLPQRHRVDKHLKHCSSCAYALAELAEIGSRMRLVLGWLVLGSAATGYLGLAAKETATLAAITSGAAAGGHGAGGGAGAGGAAAAGGARNAARTATVTGAVVVAVAAAAFAAVLVAQDRPHKARLDAEPPPAAPAKPGGGGGGGGGGAPAPPAKPHPNPAPPKSQKPPRRTVPASSPARTPAPPAPTPTATPAPTPTPQPTPQPTPPSPTPVPSPPQPSPPQPKPPSPSPPSPTPSPTPEPVKVQTRQLRGSAWEPANGDRYVALESYGAEPGAPVQLTIYTAVFGQLDQPTGTVPEQPPLPQDGRWQCSSFGHVIRHGYRCTTVADSDGHTTAAVRLYRTVEQTPGMPYVVEAAVSSGDQTARTQLVVDDGLTDPND